MRDGLFRSEVVQQRARSVFGRAIVQPYRPGRHAALACGALFLALAVLVAVGSYTPHSSASGRLVPQSGMAVIASPATGYVRRVSVGEGEATKADQPLLLVVKARSSLSTQDEGEALSEQFDLRTRAAEATRTAQAEALVARKAELARQLSIAREERGTYDLELANLDRRIELLTETRARYRELAERKYISGLQMQEREAEYLRSQDERQALSRQVLQKDRELIELAAQLSAIPNELRLLQSEFEQKQAQTAQERIDRVLGVEYLVRAPTRGRVASTAVRPGESVVAGQTLLTILPADSPLQAELHVPGSAIATVSLGQAVRLRYAAYPYMKYGQQSGQVVSISRAPLSAQELAKELGAGADASAQDAYYRVVVRLDGQHIGRADDRRPLLPGMLVEAELMGRKRRLSDWLFRPAKSLVAGN